jgi:hypothetical protein
VMGMYLRVVGPYSTVPVSRSAVLTSTRPPGPPLALSENPRLEPRFPDGWWEVSFVAVVMLDVMAAEAAPLEGGGPTDPQ